ncbi:hypothetical protein CG709_21220, partial [Lachnotalea glycerini]
GVCRGGLGGGLGGPLVGTRPVWELTPTLKMYLNNQSYYIEKAFHYWKNVINIPCSVNLSTEDMDYVVQILKG